MHAHLLTGWRTRKDQAMKAEKLTVEELETLESTANCITSKICIPGYYCLLIC